MMQVRKASAWIGIAGAVVAAVWLAGCMPLETASGHFDRTFKVNGPVRLEVMNGSGDSRVNPGPAGTVTVHADIRVGGWSLESAQRHLEEIENDPPVSQDNNLIRVGRPNWEWMNLNANYEISVPADTEVRAVSGSGSVRVTGVQGPATFVVGSGSISATDVANDTRAVVGSGNIRLADMGGEVNVTAGSGSVHVDGAKGEVRIHSGSGQIRVTQPGEEVVADAGSGGIEVTDAKGDLRLRAASGEIRVDGDPSGTNFWDLHAASGDVRLHVDREASFRLYAHTDSGNIDVGIPSVAESSSGRHDYEGRVGDGKARVDIGTASGDISVH
jgi:DUF4097 and DUF4098 domain-containing protein YvlB